MCGIVAVLLGEADSKESLETIALKASPLSHTISIESFLDQERYPNAPHPEGSDPLDTTALMLAKSKANMAHSSKPKQVVNAREWALLACKSQTHRGPDWTGAWPPRVHSALHASALAGAAHMEKWLGFAHTRLAIVRPETGSQPLVRYTGQGNVSTALAVNGEIYNYLDLLKEHSNIPESELRSDCEIVSVIWEKFRDPVKLMELLDGDFAFALYDHKSETVIAGRDRMGVAPLYKGITRGGSILLSSEMKSIYPYCSKIEQLTPGHVITLKKESHGWVQIQEDSVYRWPQRVQDPIMPAWDKEATAKLLPMLRETFIGAVKKRLMCDVPYGVLLSGGLDSSLVASIAQRLTTRGESEGTFSKLHSFSIGLQGSPDHAAAKQVANFIGTKHHEFVFTIQDGLDALSDVIYHVETFDVTTIRASTPMYLLARLVKAMGVKMVISGEGADEIFGGYLYFHHAPNSKEFHEECVRKIEMLHHYDVLRANKSSMAWGVEVRVPFLDQDVLGQAMSNEWLADWKLIKGKDHLGRKCIEKHVLRSAFDTPDDPFLPNEVLFRQKEQFSDGVGYGWIDALRDYAELQVSDAEFARAAVTYPTLTPTTKEGFMYRRIFEERFGGTGRSAAVGAVFTEPSIACSSAKALEWVEGWKNRTDPSGRAVTEVHDHGDDQIEK